MKPTSILIICSICAALSTPASAQGNALQEAFNICAGPGHTPDEQIKYCAMIVQAQGLEPDEIAFAYVDLANAYRSKGSDGEALDALNKAITLNANIWQAYIDRAFVFLNRGDFDSALNDYNAVIAIDPNKVEMFRQGIGEYRTQEAGTSTNSSSDAREQSEHDNAISELKKALVEAMTSRCSARGQSNAFDSALADCNVALKLNPAFAPALASRGFVEFRQNNLQAALADFDAAVNAAPQDARMRYMRGLIKQQMGNTADAKADMAAAEQIDPSVASKFAAPNGGQSSH